MWSVTHAPSGVTPLPRVKRLLRHAQFPADVPDLLAGFHLPYCKEDLLLAVTFSRHPCSSYCFAFGGPHPAARLKSPAASFGLVFGLWVTVSIRRRADASVCHRV